MFSSQYENMFLQHMLLQRLLNGLDDDDDDDDDCGWSYDGDDEDYCYYDGDDDDDHDDHDGDDHDGDDVGNARSDKDCAPLEEVHKGRLPAETIKSDIGWGGYNYLLFTLLLGIYRIANKVHTCIYFIE